MKLLSYPDRYLTTPTTDWDFTKESSKVELLFMDSDLRGVLEGEPSGIALAANQAGLDHRLFVVDFDFAEKNDIHPLVINPQWRIEDSDWQTENEGCLSFPGLQVEVKRQAKIFAKYQSIEGEFHERVLTGLVARMYQHECEHLDGETFLDHIPRIKRFQIMAEYRKRKGG